MLAKDVLRDMGCLLNLLADTLLFLRDKIVLLFGKEEKKEYIKKVPKYCRWYCDYVDECRDKNKGWKCRSGCRVIEVKKLNGTYKGR